MPRSDPGFVSLLSVQGAGNACGVGPSRPRAVKLVSTLCAASCIFILSGHFVCGLTSDAKSRAPIKALRNKAAACLGAPPTPPSRAPFTFVKEINLPLLSAGRGQSGRKRDACCRGEGGQSVLRGRLQPGRTSRFPRSHRGETTAKDTPSTHTTYPTPDLDADRATSLGSSSRPRAEETQKIVFLGERIGPCECT